MYLHISESLHKVFKNFQTDSGLNIVRPVKAIKTIGSKNSILYSN